MASGKERRHAISDAAGVARLPQLQLQLQLHLHLHTAHAIQRRLNRLEARLHALHDLENQASALSFAVRLDQSSWAMTIRAGRQFKR